jgi:polyisoprenoid-binding protein YceI
MLFLVSLLACADASKDKTAAAVSEPTPAAAPAVSAAAGSPDAPAPVPGRPDPIPGAESLSPTGIIGFTAAKITRTHDVRIGSWTGELALTNGILTRVWFAIDMATIATGIDKLDTHLKSQDFFDIAQYPMATFLSTSIVQGAPADSKLAGATHTVEGDMTLRGHTKHLSFPAAVDVTPSEVTARTEFFINRQDFGVAYPGKPDDLIKDEVALKVDVRAQRAGVTTAGGPKPPDHPAGTTAAP